MMRSVTRRCATSFCLAIVAVVMSTPCRALTPFEETELGREVLYSDLIISGVITTIGAKTVSQDDLPLAKHMGRDMPVTFIEVAIRDVLKGVMPESRVEVALIGNPSSGTFVMETSYDYAVGDEVIFFLRYDPEFLGGTYMLWREGVVHEDGRWMTRGGRKLIDPDLIRKAARLTDSESMFREADAVVLGSIEGVSREDFDCGFDHVKCNGDYATIRVAQSWKGKGTVGGTVLVRAIRFGTNASWYAPVPPLAVGELYLIFLKEDDVGFYPFVGFNGFLRVDGDDLIMNGYLRYPLTKSRMIESFRQEAGR